MIRERLQGSEAREKTDCRQKGSKLHDRGGSLKLSCYFFGGFKAEISYKYHTQARPIDKQRYVFEAV